VLKKPEVDLYVEVEGGKKYAVVPFLPPWWPATLDVTTGKV